VDDPGNGRLGLGDDARARQLALLVDSVTDYAIFLLDTDGHVASWNRGAERIKGYTAQEIIGRHFSTFYTAEDRARDHPAQELEIVAREGRYEEESWRVRKDGSRFWANVVITAVYGDDGVLMGYGKVTRDLTARRLSEEQLRTAASELRAANVDLDQFRRLVANVRDYAIFMLDPGGHIATWNAGATALSGYTEEEIVGRHFSTLYTAEDRARDHPARELEIAAREGRYEEENWRVRKDGTQFWANVVITAVRNDHGVLVSFAKVTRDLTARRAADQALERAHARLRRSNEELDQFAVVAAHDLSAPLNTIAGFAALLGDALPPESPPEVLEYLGHIASSTTRMQALISGLLGYARSGEVAPSPQPVDLHTATERVVEDLAGAIRERGAHVVVSLDAQARVLADRSDVEMVLRNLISNAIKFGRPEAPRVDVSVEPAEDDWRIVVADDGPGIEPADQGRIFDAFTRADPDPSREGTGLGLAICQRIVRRSGGALGVDSTTGHGSRFWFTLPREPEAPERPATAGRTAPAPS
jgi:PAS domain S-box-containing protein